MVKRERFNLHGDIEYVKSTFMIFPKRVGHGEMSQQAVIQMLIN